MSTPKQRTTDLTARTKAGRDQTRPENFINVWGPPRSNAQTEASQLAGKDLSFDEFLSGLAIKPEAGREIGFEPPVDVTVEMNAGGILQMTASKIRVSVPQEKGGVGYPILEGALMMRSLKADTLESDVQVINKIDGVSAIPVMKGTGTPEPTPEHIALSVDGNKVKRIRLKQKK